MILEMQSQQYLEVMQSTIERAEASLGYELFGLLSVPQPLFLTDKYREAPIRILVLGQETYGVYDKLSTAQGDDHDWFAKFLAKRSQEFHRFNMAIGTPVENTPFWKGFQNVVDVFGLNARSTVAWSNLIKVQLTSPVNNSHSMSKLGPEYQMRIIRWQRELAIAELAYAAPQIIIMFSGGLTWAVRHLYEADKGGMSFSQIPGLPATSGYVQDRNFANAVTVYTYHPGALRKTADKANVEQYRMRTLEWAREAWQSSLT